MNNIPLDVGALKRQQQLLEMYQEHAKIIEDISSDEELDAFDKEHYIKDAVREFNEKIAM